MSLQKFFDEDFLGLQDFLSKLMPENILISPNSPIPNDLTSLCHLLYQQTKIYAHKILDLYETLDQNYQEENLGEKTTVFESADFHSNLSPIKLSHTHYEKTIEALTKERESLLLCLERCKEKPIDIDEKIEEYDLENKEEVIKSLEGNFSRKDTFIQGCRLLQNIDYEIIREIDTKKFIAWLIIANRLKDQYIERCYEDIIEYSGEKNDHFNHKDFFYLIKRIEDFSKNKKDELKESTMIAIDGQQKDHYKGKIEYLNNEISRLNENLAEKEKESSSFVQIMREKELAFKNLEENLEKEKRTKQSLENDLTELLEEFKLMKEKFEELVKENEKLKEQNEFSEKMEDYEKLNDLLCEKEQQIQHNTEEFRKKIMEKEKEIQLQKIFFTRTRSLIFDLETRVETQMNSLLEDPSSSEIIVFRLNSIKTELCLFFKIFNQMENDENKGEFQPKTNETCKNEEKNSFPQLQIEEYWKSVVIAMTSDKERLLKKIQECNSNEVKELNCKIKKLEDNIQEKNTTSFNENYWKSLIISLSTEKEQLLKKLVETNQQSPPPTSHHNINIEELEEKIQELERVLQEKNKQIMSFNEIVHEWQKKYAQIEQDIQDNGLDALTKEEIYERELASLKEQLLINEKILGNREAEILDFCQTLSERTEKQKFLETENLKLMNELNETRLKVSKITKENEEYDGLLKTLQEEIAVLQKNRDLAALQEQKLIDLNEKFEEFRTKSFEKIENLAKELEIQENLNAENLLKLENKCKENFELSQINKEIEILSESLNKTLSLKECQIENLEKKCRLYENERSLIEKKTEELLEVKNRNKRCIETISSSSQEINNLKKQIEVLLDNQKSLENKIFEKETLIIELNHEIKRSKAEIEKKHKILQEKEDFIADFRNSQNFNNGDMEKLKKELEQKNNLINTLKKEKDIVSNEYQKLIERNEKMLLESDNFLTVEMLNKEKPQENLDSRMACLDLTNMNLMKDRKNHHEFKETANYNQPQKFIEERDMEIKRLTKIVKTLSSKGLHNEIFQTRKKN